MRQRHAALGRQIDDELLEEAMALAEPGTERSELLREGIKAFIRQQASRRLAALGGTAPNTEVAPRRRDEPGAP